MEMEKIFNMNMQSNYIILNIDQRVKLETADMHLLLVEKNSYAATINKKN